MGNHLGGICLRTAHGENLGYLQGDRLPVSLKQQLDDLVEGDFLERTVNVLASGLPGTGKLTLCVPSDTGWWRSIFTAGGKNCDRGRRKAYQANIALCRTD